MQWGASHSSIHIPARANRGSGFPELAVTPRSRMSGCGKYESGRENMNPCYGQRHCPEGLLIWVATVMQLEPLFRNRHFQCRLLLEVSVHIVLRLNKNFFPVKFCFSDLKLNLPPLVWFLPLRKPCPQVRAAPEEENRVERGDGICRTSVISGRERRKRD